MLYQAHLRAEVRERLGLEWGTVVNGMADLAGVEAGVREQFSQRRAEMLAAAGQEGAPGLGSKASSSALAVATRGRKQEPVDTPSWRSEIRARAAEHGLGEHELAQLLQSGQRALERGHANGEACPAEGLADELAGALGLTEKANAFDARDVLQAHAQNARQGRRVSAVRGDAGAFAARGDVLGTIGGGMTTAELVACEQRLVAAAVAGARSGVGVLDAPGLERAMSRGAAATLTEQQAAAVRQVVFSGNGVDVVEALAGTGKTYVAGVLREVYEADGYRVIGIAPTGRAVRELSEQAGIAAWTIDRARIDAENHGAAMPERSVVILDEAGMAATRSSEQLLARMSGCKVIVIGDSGQLSSVQAGGWMAELRARLGGPILDQVIRQRDTRERQALGALHEGRPAAWVAWAEQQDRITVAPPEQAREGALEQWAAAVAEHGLADAVLIARDNATRSALNAAARELRAGQGALGEQRDYGAVCVAVGDRVIARRNDRRYDVDNGTRGTIEAVHAHGVMLRADNGLRTELPAAYVAEHLEPAYCLTGHGMQGATVEAAIVVASPRDLTAGWSYTALSRARGATQLQVMVGQLTDAEQERAEHAPGETAAAPGRKEVLQAVMARMLVRDDEDLAIAQLRPGTIAAAVDDPELHAARAATGPAQEHGAAGQESGRVPLAHLRAELAAVEAQRELLPTAELAEFAVAEQQAARAGEQLLMLTQRLEELPAPRGRLRGGDRRAAEREALQDAVHGPSSS